MVPEYERRVDRSECVSLPHAGDTLRTSAYLCAGGPAWSPPRRVRTCWLLWLPPDNGGSGGTLLVLHSASWPWATEKLRPGGGKFPGCGLWDGRPLKAGVPAPPCPPPPAPRPPSRQQTAPSLRARAARPPERLLLTCIDVIASLGFPWKHWRAQNSNTLMQAGSGRDGV